MLACGLEFYPGGELFVFRPEVTAARKQAMKRVVHLWFQNQSSWKWIRSTCVTKHQSVAASLWIVDYSCCKNVPGILHLFYLSTALCKSISPLQECCGSNRSTDQPTWNFQWFWRQPRAWILPDLRYLLRKSRRSVWMMKVSPKGGSSVAVFSRKDDQKWTNISTRSGERNTSFWEED